jgi:hypothetical protein
MKVIAPAMAPTMQPELQPRRHQRNRIEDAQDEADRHLPAHESGQHRVDLAPRRRITGA